MSIFTRKQTKPNRNDWVRSLTRYGRLVILPVRTFRASLIELDDVCEPNEAEGWSVWGVSLNGRARSRMEDFATHREAKAFAHALRIVFPHLVK